MDKYSVYKLVHFPDKLHALTAKCMSAPLYVRIKPTNRCNAACAWCCYGHGVVHDPAMHDGIDLRDEMPTEKLLEILTDLSDIGTLCVTFTGGGEPLLHPGIVDAIEHCVDVDLEVSAITNGQLLSGPRAEVLFDASWVRVSVDYWDGPSMHASRRVKPSEFDVVTANLRAFAARKTSCELTANAIITKENCEHLAEMALWLRDCGVEQVRFAPVWVSAPVSYHAPIRETVLRNLAKAVALQTPGFRVSHSYSVDQDSTRRHFNRCCFQEIVPVIGADQIIYRCKDTSYSEAGALASLKGRSFAKVWFSDEVVQKIRAHQPKRDCDGIQCAAEAKNVLYEKMLDSYIDPFI